MVKYLRLGDSLESENARRKLLLKLKFFSDFFKFLDIPDACECIASRIADSKQYHFLIQREHKTLCTSL